jgi:hypothetical protein
MTEPLARSTRMKERVGGMLLTVFLTVACAAAPQGSARVIATLAPGVSLSDSATFERLVFARTAVKIGYVAAISDHMHAFTVSCEPSDVDCARARAALMASGLFAAIDDDRRRGRN